MLNITTDVNDFRRFLEAFRDQELTARGVRAGLNKGRKILRDEIRANVSGRVLQRRSGRFARAVYVNEAYIADSGRIIMDYGARRGGATGIPYGLIHEEGGVIYAKNHPFLVFKTQDGRWHKVKSVRIPARHPFRKARQTTLNRIRFEVINAVLKEYANAGR